MDFYMNALRATASALSAAVMAALAACSSQTPPAQPVNTTPQTALPAAVSTFEHRRSQTPDSADKTVADFRNLDAVLAAAKNGNDSTPAQFLATQSDSAMGEQVRNEWLKSLGKRSQRQLFAQEYAKLDAAGRQQEVRCYAQYYGIGQAQPADFINNLAQTTGRLPEGCNLLLQALAQQNALNTNTAWLRVLGLISNGHTTDAANLAAALGGYGNPHGMEIQSLASSVTPAAQKSPVSAAAALTAANPQSPYASFAWGVLGLAEAKNQNFTAALGYFGNAGRPDAMNTEQLEWYARSGLRLHDWQAVARAIDAMPAELKKDSTWLYWRGRAHAAQGNRTQAQQLFQAAAQTGRNFYAVLATEELGGRINTRNNVGPVPANQVQQLAQDGAFHRALTLYHTSKQFGDWKMRRQSQAEWRYATRGLNEATLLAAAELAHRHEFYEMAINSAERTDTLLNYNMRYLTPFRDLVTRYSSQNGVDPAWVYGLIRQESRFVIGAQSSVGAQGLMQVMPATAREIARKIGMDSSQLYTMDGNIRMGTWYMADARRNLQNNEVLATAGYNAGPGRARRWQAAHSLEGAIYAETIPFNETRDYVKKVMTNAVYYASLLNQPQTSLKQRMGVVPGR